jgi:hypothetical protein
MTSFHESFAKKFKIVDRQSKQFGITLNTQKEDLMSSLHHHRATVVPATVFCTVKQNPFSRQNTLYYTLVKRQVRKKSISDMYYTYCNIYSLAQDAVGEDYIWYICVMLIVTK